MSTWRKIDKEDIDISDDGKELEVLVSDDRFGNNYIEISIDDILQLLKLNEN